MSLKGLKTRFTSDSQKSAKHCHLAATGPPGEPMPAQLTALTTAPVKPPLDSAEDKWSELAVSKSKNKSKTQVSPATFLAHHGLLGELGQSVTILLKTAAIAVVSGLEQELTLTPALKKSLTANADQVKLMVTSSSITTFSSAQTLMTPADTLNSVTTK